MTITALTLEQFLALPEKKPACEFADGEVMQKAMPDLTHAMIQGLLLFVFRLYLRDRPGGYTGSELRCIFGPPGRERAYVPDVVFIRAGRLRMLVGPFRAAPDLAIEVLSPDDRKSRVKAKVRFHLENGVTIVWLVNPIKRTVTVKDAHGREQVLTDTDELTGGSVMPGFAVPVSEILPPAEDEKGE